MTAGPDAPDAGRRTRLVGVLAGAAAVVAVGVAAVLAVTAGGGDRAASDDPTVAGATARATPTTGATTTPGPEESGAVADAAPTADDGPGAAAVPGPLQGTVDIVLELESGGPVAAPAAVGDDVEVLPGVRVAVTRVQRVDGQASGPGESSGPSLALDVRLTNDSGAVVSADGLIVNVYGTDAAPGSQLLGDPRSAPLQGDIAGGASAQGVYVLTGPGGTTAGPHLVSVALGAGATTALVVLTPEAG